MELLTTILARAKEPSTWASLAGMLMLAHVNIDPGLWSTVTFWGVIAAGAAGVALSERGTKPAGQIAEDVLNQVVTAIKAQPAAPVGTVTGAAQ